MAAPNEYSSFSDLSIRGPDGSLYFTSHTREVVWPVGLIHSGSVIRLTTEGLFEYLYAWGDDRTAGGLTLLGDDGVLYGYATRYPDPFDQYDIPSTSMFRLTLDGIYTPLSSLSALST